MTKVCYLRDNGNEASIYRSNKLDAFLVEWIAFAEKKVST